MKSPQKDLEQNGAGNLVELSVTDLSRAIKHTVEAAFGYVRLRGEISGFRGRHSSGHCYFSIKDEKARIEAVVWRGVYDRLKFKPEDGFEVIATGKITTFPGHSKYQIVIDQLEPAGAGALMALLEERRKMLSAQGLFDDAAKQLLPELPRIIGVITSPTGAVIRDIIHRIEDRFPTRLLVWPVRVQGEGSGQEVANAINGFNALEPDGPIPRPDLIIVARGGGSLEDLWSFNDEVVVRAAAASNIALISAVGHETDWTLIDHAADRRAPTPTAAAEFAVPVRAELELRLAELTTRQRRAMLRLMAERGDRLAAVARGLPRPAELFAGPRQQFDHVSARLGRGLAVMASFKRQQLAGAAGRLVLSSLRRRIAHDRDRVGALHLRGQRALANRLVARRQKLTGLGKLLGSLGHKSVLARGFALVRDQTGTILASSVTATAAGALRITFQDGDIAATTAGPGQPTKKPKRAKPTRGGQGSLF
ncbi:MAG: exodeoxyribonuclease VII large subunit [Alphaproteobacteria bacterium]